MANRRHYLRFPSFLSVLDFLDILGRQVSFYLTNRQDSSGVPGLLLTRQVFMYLRPEMHLFVILENSTLRRDCDLFRQVSLYLTNLFDFSICTDFQEHHRMESLT